MQLFRRAHGLLIAGTALSMVALLPLPAAADAPSVDSLWTQQGSVSIDSWLYSLQTWWGGFNTQFPNDPTQRGFAELSLANNDLLNAYILLQDEHGKPQPVPVVDPLLARVYDAVTGSSEAAPVGSAFNGLNHALLNFEGRGSTTDVVQGLLQSYRAQQAAALRDLHAGGATGYDQLLSANAARDADLLARVEAAASAEDGISALLSSADHETRALTAGHGQGEVAVAPGNGKDKGAGKGEKTGKAGTTAQPKDNERDNSPKKK